MDEQGQAHNPDPVLDETVELGDDSIINQSISCGDVGSSFPGQDTIQVAAANEIGNNSQVLLESNQVGGIGSNVNAQDAAGNQEILPLAEDNVNEQAKAVPPADIDVQPLSSVMPETGTSASIETQLHQDIPLPPSGAVLLDADESVTESVDAKVSDNFGKAFALRDFDAGVDVNADSDVASEAEVLTDNADIASEDNVPQLSSYFGKVASSEDDPFGGIVTSDSARTTSAHDADNIEGTRRLKIDVASAQLQSIGSVSDNTGLTERDFSPPVTKDEMLSDDLVAVPITPISLPDSNVSDINRIYDAWIPIESTRRILAQAVNPNETFTVSADQLLKPRLAMADTQADPIYQEVYKLRGESEVQKRHVLNLSSVAHDMNGLHQLIKAECWRSALDLTALLLTNMGQGLQPVFQSLSAISEQSMKIWTCRIAILTKLKHYSVAEAECQQFSHMESPELYYQFHHKIYPDRTGSIVPFSLRLMYACLPQHLGRHNESLDRLFHIKGTVNRILHHLQRGVCEDGSSPLTSQSSKTASMALWHSRELQVLYSLAGCLADMKDFRLAIDIYKEIVNRDADNIHFTYSTIGRLFLLMGALSEAEVYFNKSVESCGDSVIKQHLVSLHSGYLSLCKADYSQPPAHFNQSVTAVTAGMTKNNAAVSMLYNGQLKAGLLVLEELIHTDPAKYLQDNILLNLSTLYELESSAAVTKKHQMLFLANQYKGNGFNINCLKITT